MADTALRTVGAVACYAALTVVLGLLILGAVCLAADARPSEVRRFLAVASTSVAVPAVDLAALRPAQP